MLGQIGSWADENLSTNISCLPERMEWIRKSSYRGLLANLFMHSYVLFEWINAVAAWEPGECWYQFRVVKLTGKWLWSALGQTYQFLSLLETGSGLRLARKKDGMLGEESTVEWAREKVKKRESANLSRFPSYVYTSAGSTCDYNKSTVVQSNARAL